MLSYFFLKLNLFVPSLEFLDDISGIFLTHWAAKLREVKMGSVKKMAICLPARVGLTSKGMFI